MARNPVPLALESDAQVAGMGSTPIRFWGDQLPPNTEAIVKEKWAQTRANRPELLAGGRRPVMTSLALSGGGSDVPSAQASSSAGRLPAKDPSST
jgi:hypothetical protein